MGWLNLDQAFKEFFTFKGFVKEPIKGKVKWVLMYPIIGIAYVSFVLMILLSKDK